MMGRPVEELVYDHLFPRPKVSDPQNFQSFLQRSLIPEVRQETHSFYGHLDTPEAKYPGLDYAHPTHRMRLSRWPWHRRLFRVFDGLGLTRAEVAGLARWEGTRWAKERFETEQGVGIRDTAADGFPTWEEAARWAARSPAAARAATASPALSDGGLSASPVSSGMSTPPYRPAGEDDDEDEDEDESEDELESVGVALNARLRTQAARRAAGDRDAVLDEAWEEWLKTAIESGELAVVTEQLADPSSAASAPRAASPSALPAALLPTGMLDLARGGQWSDVPDFLRPMLREVLRGESAAGGPSARADPARPELAATPRALRRQLTAATPRSAMGWTFGGRVAAPTPTPAPARTANTTA